MLKMNIVTFYLSVKERREVAPLAPKEVVWKNDQENLTHNRQKRRFIIYVSFIIISLMHY